MKAAAVVLILIGAVFFGLVLERGFVGAGTIVLICASAWANVRFLSDPLGAKSGRRALGVWIAILAILANVAIQLVLGGNAVVAILVWLPALAAKAASTISKAGN